VANVDRPRARGALRPPDRTARSIRIGGRAARHLGLAVTERWAIQLVFDLPGLRSTGFFLELDGDRVVDACAVD
jgi:hypothetical protein